MQFGATRLNHSNRWSVVFVHYEQGAIDAMRTRDHERLSQHLRRVTPSSVSWHHDVADMTTFASEEFVQFVTDRHATHDLAIDFRNKEGCRDATGCEVDGLALTIESIKVVGPGHAGLVPETEYVPIASARLVRGHEGLLVDCAQKAKAQPFRTVPSGWHRRSLAQPNHDSLEFSGATPVVRTPVRRVQ